MTKYTTIVIYFEGKRCLCRFLRSVGAILSHPCRLQQGHCQIKRMEHDTTLMKERDVWNVTMRDNIPLFVDWACEFLCA